MRRLISLHGFAEQLWYERRHAWTGVFLLPLSWLFAVIVAVRRWTYRRDVLVSVRIDRPVIVIGNVTVGGTGKTPLVSWLANECARRGVRAGVICRGYGGEATQAPVAVHADSDPRLVGDEAVLLAQSFTGIVVASADRVAAARHAVELGAEIILCDDGLQHYALARDCEIIVVDAARGWGNGRMLPAGPLREPIARTHSAQLLVRSVRGGASDPRVNAHLDVRMQVDKAVSLVTGEERPLTSFRQRPVHALAAIGHPEAFFAMLRERGLTLDARGLPDHARLAARDVEFSDRHPVLMTDKDAVKCRGFADDRLWRVPLQVEIASQDQALLWDAIRRALDAHRRHS